MGLPQAGVEVGVMERCGGRGEGAGRGVLGRENLTAAIVPPGMGYEVGAALGLVGELVASALCDLAKEAGHGSGTTHTQVRHNTERAKWGAGRRVHPDPRHERKHQPRDAHWMLPPTCCLTVGPAGLQVGELNEQVAFGCVPLIFWLRLVHFFRGQVGGDGLAHRRILVAAHR